MTDGIIQKIISKYYKSFTEIINSPYATQTDKKYTIETLKMIDKIEQELIEEIKKEIGSISCLAMECYCKETYLKELIGDNQE